MRLSLTHAYTVRGLTFSSSATSFRVRYIGASFGWGTFVGELPDGTLDCFARLIVLQLNVKICATLTEFSLCWRMTGSIFIECLEKRTMNLFWSLIAWERTLSVPAHKTRHRVPQIPAVSQPLRQLRAFTVSHQSASLIGSL